jgi:hypothetical protein
VYSGWGTGKNALHQKVTVALASFPTIKISIKKEAMSSKEWSKTDVLS